MSKRQKQTSVLCSASSLLGIWEKVVHKGHGRCVCRGGRVQVCVCVGEGGSLQENTEILLIQSVCGGEEIRVKKMNTLASEPPVKPAKAQSSGTKHYHVIYSYISWNNNLNKQQ